jgi:toxin-antitoxin system PIN domain toxin
VIVVDANLLIYAYDTGCPQHHIARPWLARTFGGREAVGIPWAVAHAFLRVTTHGRILDHPFTPEEATTIVQEWFAAPPVRRLDPGLRYWAILRELMIGEAAKVGIGGVHRRVVFDGECGEMRVGDERSADVAA